MQEDVLELLDIFSKQGHSGASADYCLNIFEKLARYKPLSPLTFDENEWVNVHDNVFQNCRNSAVFKEDNKGKSYFINAFILKSQTGNCWHGSLKIKEDVVLTKCFIKDPNQIPTIYIDVIDDEIEMIIKDESQLDELRKYYDLDIDNKE